MSCGGCYIWGKVLLLWFYWSTRAFSRVHHATSIHSPSSRILISLAVQNIFRCPRTLHHVDATQNLAKPPQDRLQRIWASDAVHGCVGPDLEFPELALLTTAAGDTKYGVLIGKDRYGNKYYENLEQDLPLRTRWVDYKDKELDASQIDPGWHAWMSYMVDKPPVEDALMEFGKRPWESPETKVNLTQSRGAYRPYSTCVRL